MSVVIDSSVLVAALIDTGPDGNWAEDVLSNGPLHAPELARVETVNVLRRLEQARRIAAVEANLAFENFTRLALELYPFDPFASRIWALRGSVTCYDAWYVALAEFLTIPLATLDRRLAAAKGVRCKFLVPPVR